MFKETPREDFIHCEQDLRNAGYHTDELLPCPFCGCREILTTGKMNRNSGYLGYHAFCTNTFKCGAMISVCIGKEDTAMQARAEVVRKWNTRK